MKESQQTMMQHSEVKILLLKTYLERYLNVISASNFFGNIHLYDLFCGEGIYENKGKGSPIVILETIKSTYFANKAKGIKNEKFNCHFNDIEKWKIEKLKSEVEKRKLHYSEIGGLKYTELDYEDLVPKIVDEIDKFKKEKAFIFIDPYGYKDVKVANIRNLLKSHKSEVLLFLPTQFMFRFERHATPACLVDFISELMPKEQWPASETGIDFIRNLTDAFRGALGQDYFVDSFIITREKNQFFCLFFFTSHIYGFDRMLDSKWKIDEEEGRGWQFKTESLLFNQGIKKPNTYKFELKLIEFLKTERTNGQLYQFTLHNGHLPSHTTEILTQLQSEHRLIALKSDGTKARRSAFYISYPNYKEAPKKIRIKIR